MDDSTSSENPILNLLNEDNYTINYRPAFARMAGSVTAGILLQQMFYRWTRHGCEPFYKFKEPCQHEDYQPGDSWCEELAFTRREFDGAISAIGTKVTKGQKKADLMAYQWPPLPADQTSAEYKRVWQEAVRHIVIYWTDSNRKTWYWVNEALLEKVIEATYSGKGAFRLYLENGGKRLYLGNGGKRLYPEPAESADTCLSETPSETPTQTPPEIESPTTTESGDSAREAPAATGGDDVVDDDLDLILPEIRKLHLTPDTQQELLALGADQALAITWAAQGPGARCPGGLAVTMMHKGGPPDEILDQARIALELHTLDRETVSQVFNRRQLAALNDQVRQSYEPGEANGWDPPRPPETTGTALLDATLDEKPPGKTLSWRDMWTAVLGGLQARLNPSTYASWVEGAKAVSYGDGVLTVRARHIMAQDWLSKREKEIGESLARLVGMPVRVAFITGRESAPSVTGEPEPQEHPTTSAASPETPEPVPLAVQPEPGEKPPVETPVAAEEPLLEPDVPGPPGWESLRAFWAAVLEQVKPHFSDKAFRTWFAGTQAVAYADGELILKPHPIAAHVMARPHHAPLFRQAFGALTTAPVRVRFQDEVGDAATV